MDFRLLVSFISIGLESFGLLAWTKIPEGKTPTITPHPERQATDYQNSYSSNPPQNCQHWKRVTNTTLSKITWNRCYKINLHLPKHCMRQQGCPLVARLISVALLAMDICQNIFKDIPPRRFSVFAAVSQCHSSLTITKCFLAWGKGKKL